MMYVDDILIACKDMRKIEDTVRAIEEHFIISNLGNVKTYLLIQVDIGQEEKNLAKSKIPGFIKDSTSSQNLPNNVAFSILARK